MRYQRDGFSVKAAITKGRPLPTWYVNRPEVVLFEDFYLQAFFDLCTTRVSADGLSPIPWDKILLYAEHSKLERDNYAFFCRLIRSMDAAYLEDKAEEISIARKPKGK